MANKFTGKRVLTYAMLLLNLLTLPGCIIFWPPKGTGGMAEHYTPVPKCVDYHIAEGSTNHYYSTLKPRMGCALRRHEMLVHEGAVRYAPALAVKAHEQRIRVQREVAGGLYSDASIDLQIYLAMLDEIEQKMLLETQAVNALQADSEL